MREIFKKGDVVMLNTDLYTTEALVVRLTEDEERNQFTGIVLHCNTGFYRIHEVNEFLSKHFELKEAFIDPYDTLFEKLTILEQHYGKVSGG